MNQAQLTTLIDARRGQVEFLFQRFQIWERYFQHSKPCGAEMIRAKFISLFALLSSIGLAFGGCVSTGDGMQDVWKGVAYVNSELYRNCAAIQAVGAIAAANSDSKRLDKVNTGLAVYCNGPVSNTAEAIIKTAQIYSAVK